MPEGTFIHKEAKSMPGFRAFQNRIPVLIRGSVVAYGPKPFVLWHNENIWALKHVSQHTLPVYYRSPGELLCQRNGEVLFGGKHTSQDFAYY